MIDTRNLRNINDLTESTQDYITIQRGAKDGNPFLNQRMGTQRYIRKLSPVINTTINRPNYGMISWDTTAYDVSIISRNNSIPTHPARRALRPIVEFKRDIELMIMENAVLLMLL